MGYQSRDSEENKKEMNNIFTLHLPETRQVPERGLSMAEDPTSQGSHDIMNRRILPNMTGATTNIEPIAEDRKAPSSISGLLGPEDSRIPGDSHSGSESDSSMPSIIDGDSDNEDLE